MDNIKITKGKIEKIIDSQSLQNEIAICLEFENLNFLLGAGCSSLDIEGEEKGIPTMAGLTKEFYESHSDLKINNTEYAKDRFNNSLEDLLNYYISILNIEGETSIDYQKQISMVKEFIFNKICAPLASELLSLYKDFYTKIVNKNRSVPINVYTTNYDIYNETALDELKFMYNNGFSGSSKRIFNPNSYNYVLVENLNLSKKVWRSVNNFINLYKIHGSINWIKEKNKGALNLSEIIEKDIEIIKRNKKFESLMIYPTPQKDRSTLMVPYSDLFRLMQNNLMKANSILICIGYSFSDEHINRIILNALSLYDFRLVVFGKSPFIDKLKEIGDNRIWIINSENKIHYFNNFVEFALPPLDDGAQELKEIKNSISKLTALFSKNGEVNE